MSGWYFCEGQHQIRLIEELNSWRGTRFHQGCKGEAKRGVRADCVSFVESVFVGIGVIQPIEWPHYVVFGGGRKMLKLMFDVLADIPKLENIWVRTGLPNSWVGNMLCGDILLCSSGRALHHLAIYTHYNTIWHATQQGNGVCTGNIYDPVIRDHLQAVYRFRA